MIRFSNKEGTLTSMIDLFNQTIVITYVLLLFWNKDIVSKYPEFLRMRIPFSILLVMIEVMTIYLKFHKPIPHQIAFLI